jgi:hypothetical protein
MMQLSLG